MGNIVRKWTYKILNLGMWITLLRLKLTLCISVFKVDLLVRHEVKNVNIFLIDHIMMKYSGFLEKQQILLK